MRIQDEPVRIGCSVSQQQSSYAVVLSCVVSIVHMCANHKCRELTSCGSWVKLVYICGSRGDSCLGWCRSQRDRGHSRDSPDPPLGPGAGHRSRSPSPFPGARPPGTTTADFQRQQMAEGLDGLEPAGPREAAAAAATKSSHSAPKPQNSKAATDEARSADSGIAAAAADGDSAVVGNGTEEGEVGTVDASNGNVSGKVGGSSNGGPVLQNGAKGRRGQMHARGYGNRTDSPEPSARGGGHGRADGANEAPSLPSVIAGVSSKDAQCCPIASRTMPLSCSMITCSSIPNTVTMPDQVQMHECS